MERFVAERFSARALEERSASERIAAMWKLRLDSGGIDLVEVIPASGEHPMSMLVRSRRGDRYARVTLAESEGRLLGLGVSPADAPASVRRRRWPSGALSERERIDAIRRELDRRAGEGSFSGVLLVARGDEILLHEARGLADRERGVENETATAFHLASVGKLFTAAAIAQLVEEGRLSFDTTIAEVLPDYPDPDVADKVTVHHLLTHTSGLGTFFGSPGYVPGRVYENGRDQLAVFAGEPLRFEPGSRWRYSNAGFAVLEAMVEGVTGEPFGRYLERRIFAPLGMRNTNREVALQSAPAVSSFYTPADDDPFGVGPPVASPGWKERRPAGFGEGYSTAEDLYRFVRGLRGGRIVSDETLAAMFDAKVEVGRGEELNLRGMRERKVNGETVRGHTGGGRADVQMLWESDYTIIVLTNLSPPAASAFGEDIVEFLTGPSGD